MLGVLPASGCHDQPDAAHAGSDVQLRVGSTTPTRNVNHAELARQAREAGLDDEARTQLAKACQLDQAPCTDLSDLN